MAEITIKRMTKMQLQALVEAALRDIQAIKSAKNLIDTILESEPESSLNNIVTYERDIKSKRNEICGDGEDSIQSKLSGLQDQCESQLSDLNSLSEKWLGAEGNDGLCQSMKNQVKEWEVNAAKLRQEINKCLEGATTVALAQTFSEKVDEYKKSRQWWQFALIALFILIIGFSGYSAHVLASKEEVKLLDYLFYIPAVGFLVWFIVFLGNRRAEAHKLEEHYKHKFVMAKAFIGYKNSLADFADEEDDGYDLLKKHADNLLSAISVDSSHFIKATGENHPLADAAINIGSRARSTGGEDSAM